ncbi:MAG: T9SS type A sorting domain-containing protein, partial [Bacteroidota bacterium]
NYQKMAMQRILLLSVTLLLIGSIMAQKPVPTRSFEFGQRTYPDAEVRGNMRVDLATGTPLAIYNPDVTVQGATPEAMAREYLAANRALFGLSERELADLRLHAVRESRAGTVVRLRQYHQGIPVNTNEMTISISPENKVCFVMNSLENGVTVANVTPALSVNDARTIAEQYLNVSSAISFASESLQILAQNREAHLVYRILLEATAPLGHWEVMVDAQTGELHRVENVACFYHDHHAEVQPTLPPAAPNFMQVMATGTGNIFDPDPLSSANATYGQSGYTDNNDNTTPQLIAEQKSVTLRDITFSGGQYSLIGPWAEIQDFESPFRGLFSQASNSWNVNRDNNAFEAVNVYYHLDASMRLLNETLGVTVRPSLYTGGVRFDPSAVNNADNSYYSRGSQRLAFGDGGVDDAEDSDVIHHELGHGLHDWITSGGLSQVNGLSEGSGDYWAASYNRSLGDWNPSDPAYGWVFNWDGHNAFWNGRIVNISSTYPSGLSGSIHASGQLWATSMMLVWDEIGQAKTDVIFWEGLGMTNGSSNQNDAANAVYQTATNLGYTNAERLAIHTTLTNRGYTLPTFVLPVTWSSFTARAENNHVKLSWSTANETDNDFFTVERSTDGRRFASIATISGRGNSTTGQGYDFIDANPVRGSNHYRIKQTDVDGTFSYTDIKIINFGQNGDWDIMPNPASDQLTISLVEATPATSVRIVDLSGREVVARRSLATNSQQLNLPLADLPAGIYLVQLYRGNQLETRRFIKE